MKKLTARFGAISKIWADRKYRQNRKLSLILTVMCLITSSQLSVFKASADTTKTYTGSTEDFPNPERGFYVPFNPGASTTSTPLSLTALQELRSKNITLVRRFYLISDFKDKPLSDAFLNVVAQDFANARKAGVKLIIRFTYNWLGGGADASRDRIIGHLEQLRPLFTANYDVVNYVQAGFVGHYGEWHHSTNNLLNLSDMQSIVSKWMSVLPQDRMVALRYQKHKIEIYNNANPLTPTEAYQKTNRSRTGHVNQCFLASIDDWGTYRGTDPASINTQKDYFNIDNLYVLQGGETCNADSDARPYIGCDNALKEMARMRWRDINSKYEPTVLQGWVNGGCMDKIKRSLGYRFRMVKSVMTDTVKPGGAFKLQLDLVNDGWGSLFNPRRLEVILRNTQLQKEYYLPVLSTDPRFWVSGSKSLTIDGGLPTNIPAGNYEVLVSLPDPASNIYRRPEYAVRLANTGTWESSTGYNKLNQTLTVSTSAAGTAYSGNRLFQQR